MSFRFRDGRVCDRNRPDEMASTVLPQPKFAASKLSIGAALATLCIASLIGSTPLFAQAGAQVGDSFGFSRWNLISRPRAIAVSITGNPIVAWDRYSYSNGSSRIFVSVFDGSGWLLVGDEVNSAVQNVVINDLEVDPLGRPVVAWSASTSRYAPRRQYVSRWEDDHWNDLGGGPVDRSEDRSAYNAKLEIGPFGEPMVSWTEQVGRFSRDMSFVKSWNGSRWLAVGDDAGRIRAFVSDLEVVVRPDGIPAIYAAVSESDVVNSGWPDRIVLYRFNGDRWLRLPNDIERFDPDETVFASIVDLELQTNGRPIVLWTEGPTTTRTPWLARYSRDGWQYFDTSTLPNAASLVICGTRQPVVATRDSPELTSSLFMFRYGQSESPLISGEWRSSSGLTQPGNWIQAVSDGTNIYTAVYDREQGGTTIVVRRY